MVSSMHSAQLFVSGTEASPQGLLGAYGKKAEVSLGIPLLQAYCSPAQLRAAQQSSCVKMQQLCKVPFLSYSARLSDKALPFICTGKEAGSVDFTLAALSSRCSNVPHSFLIFLGPFILPLSHANTLRAAHKPVTPHTVEAFSPFVRAVSFHRLKGHFYCGLC